MRNLLSMLIIAVLLGAAAAAESATTLWRIGSRDNKHSDLAGSGNYQQLAPRFASDITYVVGKSKAEKDWPYVHPGKDDTWAGSKDHPFSIEFSLKSAPEKACRLNVYLMEIHPGNPPALKIRVNGNDCPVLALPDGKDEAALSRSDAGHPSHHGVLFPGNWLHAGKNTIEISAVEGSWVIYDALSLESGLPNTPVVNEIFPANTPCFRKVNGELKQAVLVSMENTGLEGKVTLRLDGEGGVEEEVTLKQGHNTCYLLVPPFTRKEYRGVTLKNGSETCNKAFEAKPERFWKLFVAASAHTDIGYTDLQEKCMALHVENALSSINASMTRPDFTWNLEVFAQADWFKELKPEEVSRLEQCIRDRKIGLTGFYLNMLTGLCSGEEMMWLMRPAQCYSRSLGVPVEMVSLNDVPSTMGTLPMFFKHAGIRYFADAINEDRGPSFLHAEKNMIQSPFWWESFDGSRVLAIFTCTYWQAKQIKLDENVDAMAEALPKFMGKFMHADYPGDAIFINGAFLDNCPMSTHFSDVADEWNARWEYPQIIQTTPDEYFRYVEKNSANDLPVYRGDMGGFWEDGAASTAHETSMARWSKASISTAEKWQALAKLAGKGNPSEKDYEAIWRDILYYDEHTWGSAESIANPSSDQSMGQWTRKANYAKNALEKSRNAEKTLGLDALTAISGSDSHPDGRTIVVSNALSWPRNIVVDLPAGVEEKIIREEATGKRIKSQKTAAGGRAFIAEAVPAMGYRRYVLDSGGERIDTPLLEQDGDAYTWKSDRYRLHIDPKTGGLDRITDRVTGKEWVDNSAGFSMNQFLYVSGGENTAMIHPGANPEVNLKESTHDTATVALQENGPVRAVLHITRTGAEVSPIDTDLVIHADGVIDVINLMHKKETLDREGGYFVFPFGLNTPDSASAYMEVPYGIVQADQEQMPGACREWYSVNTFAATGTADGAAYVAAPDTPLFTVGDINRGRWPNRVFGHRNVLYAYVFNNYWHTNYKASQGGDIRCAFSIKLSDTPYDPVAATRFGWARTLDMTPDRSAAHRSKDHKGSADHSFLHLDEGPVLIGDLIPSEEGVLARLYNPSTAAAETGIHCIGEKHLSLFTTDLFGQKGVAVPESGKITVPARGIVTVLLKK